MGALVRTSNGKVRPNLPRRGELPRVDAAKVQARQDASKAGRTTSGRFAAGNCVSADRGWRTALSRIVGREPSDPVMRTIATDAARLNGAILRDLPSGAVLVRTNVASLAMHAAVEGYWSAQALDLGLSTPEGQAASKLALEHGLRVERLSVTVAALAAKLATDERLTSTAPALAAAARRLRERRAERVEVVDDDGQGESETP